MTITMPPNLRYKRGSVVLVLYPDSNLRTAKSRPALIVQADNLKTGLPQVIVAMITSNMIRSNHLSRVTVQLATDIGKRSGLLSDSVVMTDNLATLENTEIYRVIGRLPMTSINEALRHTLDL